MKKHLKISLLALTAVGLLSVAGKPCAQTIDFSASVQDPLVYGSPDRYEDIYGDTLRGSLVDRAVYELQNATFNFGYNLGSQLVNNLLLNADTRSTVDTLSQIASKTDDEILANGPTVEAAQQMADRDKAKDALGAAGLGSSYLDLSDPFAPVTGMSGLTGPTVGTGGTGQEGTEPETTAPTVGTGGTGQERTETETTAPAVGAGGSGQEVEEPD